MQQLAQVWVIVLNWNGGDKTLACLESLRPSTHPVHGVLVDNGSTDGSPERATALFPEIELLHMGSNRGFSAGVNRGIERALAGGADFVLLLNNDACAAPDMVARLVKHAESHPRCGLLSPLIYQQERTERLWVVGGHWRRHRLVIEGWDTPDQGQYTRPIPFDVVFGTGLMICRAVLERVGLLDERFFVYFEDVDLCLRARQEGFSSVVVPDARLWHAGAHSTRGRPYLKEYLLERSRLLLFRKHLTAGQFAWYCLLQAPTHLRRIAYRLVHFDPLGALGYVHGVLSGLRGALFQARAGVDHAIENSHV